MRAASVSNIHLPAHPSSQAKRNYSTCYLLDAERRTNANAEQSRKCAHAAREQFARGVLHARIPRAWVSLICFSSEGRAVSVSRDLRFRIVDQTAPLLPITRTAILADHQGSRCLAWSFLRLIRRMWSAC